MEICASGKQNHSVTFKKNSTLGHQIRGCGVVWFILAGLGPADPGSKA